ncbi:MAG: slr1659 superfamily regulator [Solirubrobacterales bacterium]
METVITGETFSVDWDADNRAAALKGILRLNGLDEYAPIAQFLSNAVPEGSMTLDLRQLAFLNSSGIAMLSKFVIEVRNRKTVDLTVLGSKDVSWQGKSLVNLCKLMPSLRMEIA